MRPLKLTFQAFISYRDKVSIDFSSFDNDIFLISGDTGSGKTTIFEAICFALYGKPSGEYRKPDDLRCNFSNPDEETFVDFTFEVNNVTYNIVRTPKQDVAKKRGTGLITRNSSAVLTYKGKPPISKLSEVDRKIEDIIGLDRNQFKQTMMIAQNDFMKLINSKTKERKEIYEKIFDTYDYKYFTENLKSLQKIANDKLISSDSGIKTHLTTIDTQDEELNVEIKEAVKGFLLDEKLDLLIDDIKKYQDEKLSEIESKRKDKSVLERAIETKQNNIAKIENTNERIDKYFNSKKTLDDLETRRDVDYLPRKNKIERIEQAKEVRTFENAYKVSLTSKGECERKDVSWNNKKIELEKQLKIALEDSQKAETKKPEIEKLQSEKTSISNTLGKYRLLSTKILDKTNAKNKLDETDRKLSSTLFSIQTKSKEYKTNDETISTIKITESDIVRSESRLTELDNLVENLDNINGFFNKIESSQNELTILKSNLKDQLVQLNKLGKIKNDVTMSYYANMAGVLASELEDNKPCPVCGSLTHPAVASILDEVVDKETFNGAVKDYDSKEKAVNKLASNIETKEKLIENDAANIVRSNKNYFEFNSNDIKDSKSNFKNKEKTVEDELVQLNFDLTSDKESLKVKNALIKTQETLEEEIETLKALKTELTIRKNTETNTLSSISESLEDLKKELPYESKEDADSRITEITCSIDKYQEDIKSALDSLTEVKSNIESNNNLLLENGKNLEKINIELRKNKEKFEDQISTRKFKSVEDYHDALFFENELYGLKQYVVDFDSALNIAKGNLEAYKEYKDKVKVDTFIQLNEVKDLKEEKTSIEREISNLESNYSQNKNSLANIAKIRKDRVKQEEEANRLSLLYKTASGNLTQKAKIDFETYIQTAYFNQILNKANVRFERMCNNRYQLVKVKQEKISADYALDIFVYDNYTGMTRNASTLSGGESFMATLALALGLSDVILESNGGIRLDSMFIDEGFGSLDDESLSSALEVLSNLSNGSRMVGIISHVDELKTKINKQIEITKDNDGSHLKIKV